jgi:CxxC motif-containing protein (DUF1111 family)
MRITLVKPDAMIQTTSYCRKLPDGSEQDISYYEVADTVEIDLDLLTFRLNAVLGVAQRKAIMPHIEQFFTELLESDNG